FRMPPNMAWMDLIEPAVKPILNDKAPFAAKRRLDQSGSVDNLSLMVGNRRFWEKYRNNAQNNLTPGTPPSNDDLSTISFSLFARRPTNEAFHF
ncbi:MAG: hypothetical protein WBY88_03730, partial [Desulfosarcina sp.]